MKKSRLVEALEAKYTADMKDAVARFEVYIQRSAGIGEHPQITEEMDKLVDQFTNATDKLESLKKMVAELNEH